MTQGLTPASQDPGPDQLPLGPPSLSPGPRGQSRAHGVLRGQDQAADPGQGNPGACHDREQGQVHLTGPSLELGLGLRVGARGARGRPRAKGFGVRSGGREWSRVVARGSVWSRDVYLIP